MTYAAAPRWTVALFAGLFAPLAGLAGPATAQDDTERYLGAVSEYFDVPPSEVTILSQRSASPDEVAVVLFVSRRGGASPDALIALRRTGQGWDEIADRYGVHAGTFHIEVDPLPTAGVLGSAFQAFGSRGRGEWASISLSDEAISQLVHLRFLSNVLGVTAGEVAAVLARESQPVVVFRILRGG